MGSREARPRPPRRGRRRAARPGQATIELIAGIGMLTLLLTFLVGLGTLQSARQGVAATAREAARAGALASNAGEAVGVGGARGLAVGRGYGLTNGTLTVTVDAGAFGPGGFVRATATYEVRVGGLAIPGVTGRVVRSAAMEEVAQYRSR